jgi:hypothetical protein
LVNWRLIKPLRSPLPTSPVYIIRVALLGRVMTPSPIPDIRPP